MRPSLRLVSTLVALSVAANAAASIPTSERNALIAFYAATAGASWTRSQNWNGPAGSECTWVGVECAQDQSTVIGLHLDYNNVSGPIPSAIAGLPNLATLDLSGDPLAGTVPSFLTQLTHLETLRLNEFYGGKLTGGIPSALGNLSTLKVLDLSGNALGGTIPASLATLPQLRELGLAANGLTGEIPPALFDRSTLTHLDLFYNSLTGTIPPNASLPNLTYLDLSQNQLGGTIPASITTLPALQTLDLNSNSFSGSVPSAYASPSALQYLDLSRNALTGPVPPQLGALSSLTTLFLHRNPLSGTIPPALGNLTRLELLALSETNLGGAIPPELFALTSLRELHLEHDFYDGAETERFSGDLAAFGALRELRVLHLGVNAFRGLIPVALTQLPNLTDLQLENNPINAPIPPAIANLVKLQHLDLDSAGLTGAVPDALTTIATLRSISINDNEITALPNGIDHLANLEGLSAAFNDLRGTIPLDLAHAPMLQYLDLSENAFTGTIPPELFAASTLRYLYLAGNNLEGTIPSMSALRSLAALDLSANSLTGTIPSDIGAAIGLIDLKLADNALSGDLPRALLTLPGLENLHLERNDLTGTLPDFAALTALRLLDLSGNHFNGPIPPSIGALASLYYLSLGYNALSGQIPREIANLSSLSDGNLVLDKNALYNSDTSIAQFLTSKAGLWENFQTVAPANATINAVHERSITMSWTPIRYTSDAGGYSIFVSTSPNGPFDLLVTTPDKSTTTFSVDGLVPNTDYYLRVVSVTYPSSDNDNTVTSDPTVMLHGRTTTGVPNPPSVALLTSTEGLFANANEGGATDHYLLTNLGDLPTTITLTQSGDFFTQSPTTFVLEGGASQRVDITALPRPDGTYSGLSIPGGTGVPASLTIPVRLLSVTQPQGTVTASASTNRVDVSAAVDATGLGGSVIFRNSGSATLVGIVVADVAWIIPPQGRITIPAGGETTVAFTIDRTKRPPDSSVGAAVGTLSLIYAAGSNSARPFDGATPPAASLVTVIDTITPPSASHGFDPIGAGVVPLFLPGIGHLQGSTGLFLSDISIINAFGTTAANDISIYYTTAAGFPPATSLTSISGVQLAQTVAFADVVNGVFGNQQQGTIQIRSRDWKSLAVASNIFNVTNSRGTYGTSIPLFRGDRALLAGESLQLVGVRKGGGFHTNILLQETSGNAASANVTFYGANGAEIVPAGGAVTASVPAFQLTRLLDVVPPNAILATVTNRADSTGRLVAYATPLDEASGDFWAIADWSALAATARNETQIIPVAGSVHGANDNFFRTELAISNLASADNIVTFDYYYGSGTRRGTQTLDLHRGETRLIDDLIGLTFPEAANSVGYLVASSTGPIAMNSRLFATQQGLPGSFGAAVPSLTQGAALHAGQSRFFAGLEVASQKTIGARKPATFRTNLGLTEVAGKAATVRISAVYSDLGAGSLASRLVTTTIDLAPHEQRLLSVAQLVAGANPSIGDLRNVRVDVTVKSGDGAVIAFTSSTDNGTADQIVRVE